jgi:cob(I)alamin adenosyltransferase
MKIYTKSGDKGETSLLGGARVKKYDLRIAAYGTADELNSWIGLIKDQEIDAADVKFLVEIQNKIFTIGSHLAALGNKQENLTIPEINAADVTTIELRIDEIQEKLPAMKNFILPGGHTTVSFCHLARTVCRRCERLVIEVSDNETVNPIIVQYFNRLSDFLFVFSRKLSHDLGAVEIPWNSKK